MSAPATSKKAARKAQEMAAAEAFASSNNYAAVAAMIPMRLRK